LTRNLEDGLPTARSEEGELIGREDKQPESFLRERPPQVIEVAPQVLRHWARREVLLFGAGAVAALVGGGSLLPERTLKRMGVIQGNKNWPKTEWLLNRSLRFDDDVAEALYSPRSRTITTEPRQTPVTFQNGV
jgi:hypothetical protein